jgi:hypothetical protein
MDRALSLMERLAQLPKDRRDAVVAAMPAGARLRILTDWRWTARPSQLAPEGDWSVWLIMAGRGFGKTRAGAEWVTEMARATPGVRIALVGATAHDASQVMLEGESGLLNVGRASFRPVYKPSRKALRWPNGSVGSLFSAVEPDQLRGPQFHYAWCDEIAAWPKPKAAYDNLRMARRTGWGRSRKRRDLPSLWTPGRPMRSAIRRRVRERWTIWRCWRGWRMPGSGIETALPGLGPRQGGFGFRRPNLARFCGGAPTTSADRPDSGRRN